MITISFISLFSIRAIVGERRIELDLPAESTVEEVMAWAVERWGAPMAEQLFGGHQSKVHPLNIMINGRSINILDGMRTQLKDGDELLIFPPAGGG